MSLLISLNRHFKHISFLGTGKSRAFLFLFLPVLFFVSCGLPTGAYLDPPSDIIVQDSPESLSNANTLVFRNAYENASSVFQGYEVYYKIYDPKSSSASYSADVTTIENKGSAATYTNLALLGFNRLCFFDTESNEITNSADDSKPAFKLDEDLLDTNFRISLKFIQDSSAIQPYVIEPYLTSITFDSDNYIYRRVYDDADSSTAIYTAKTFSEQSFDVYDSDMPSSITESLAGDDYEFYITFYILSFGRESDGISTVYSEPAYLGTLSFNCILTNSY